MSKQESKTVEPGSLKEFLDVAFPLIVSNASLAVMQFVDRLYLSWSSSEDIAASIPAGILFYTAISVFLGIAGYTNTLVAQAYGAGRGSLVGRSVWQGIYFSIATGVLALVLIPPGLWLLESAHHGAGIVEREKLYYSWLMAGSAFFILQPALSSYFSGIGRTGTVMRVTLAANVVNAVLNYGLIFGKLGFPCLGITGSAIATVAANAFMVLVYLVLFLSEEAASAHGTRTEWRPDMRVMRALIGFGAPAGIQFLLDVGAFAAFILLIGQLGPVELATSNIVLSLNTLAFFPMIGAHVATATLVGQYMGRREPEHARRCTWTALMAVEAYMLLFGVVYLLFPRELMHLFAAREATVGGNFAQVEQLGAQLLVLVALYQASDAMNLTFSGSLKGAGDTQFAMWACVLCAWVFFVPGTWLALFVFGWGVWGAWLWATFYLVLLGGIYFWRFHSGRWQEIQLLDWQQAEIPASRA